MDFKRKTRIILTGGPCSGKSYAIENFFSNDIVKIPEVATYLLENNYFPAPPEGDKTEWQANFQDAILKTQFILESEIFHNDDNYFVVQDRGIADGAAYMPNGIKDLEEKMEKFFGMKVYEQIGWKTIVVILSIPDEKSYNKLKETNPHRMENYADALKAHNKIIEVYQASPYKHVIISGSYKDNYKAIEKILN